jgi:hypothetical protein
MLPGRVNTNTAFIGKAFEKDLFFFSNDNIVTVSLQQVVFYYCIQILTANSLVALMMLGAGFAASFPVILGYIGHIYANLSGTAFSIAFVIGLTGNTLINYSFGLLSNQYGTKQLPVLLSMCHRLFTDPDLTYKTKYFFKN